jgi:flagellar hook-basal body complex protein FliE
MNSKATKEEEALVEKQVMLSNENIKKISSIASNNNMSFSEVLRNAIDWYDAEYTEITEDDKKILSELIVECEESTERARIALDKGHKDFNKMLKRLSLLERKL